MSFAKFFRKKISDATPPVVPSSRMKAAHSLDGIKDYNKSSAPKQNDYATANGLPIVPDNRLDDISVHLAASKYSKNHRRRSQLLKSLPETLNDKDALAYFIQYLDSKGKANLVKFWLDVHAFRTCFTARLVPPAHRCPTSKEDDWSDSMGQPVDSSQSKFPGMASCLPYDERNGDVDVKTESENQSLASNSSTQQCVNGESTSPEQQDSVGGDMENDAILIFKKYFSWESRHRLDLPDELRDSVARRVCRCRDNEAEGLDCFEECKGQVYVVLEKEYYPQYLQSSYHCKHQLDILTGNFLTIMDVIYHDISLSYFTEFMEQGRCMDYLQCFLDVDNFHRHFSNLGSRYDHQVAQQDAMIIYDKFFSLQALRPLNLSDGVRLEVEGAICREGGPLPDCFVLPRSLLLYKMEQEHFPKFLKSDLYYKYLVDLINTVHASNDIPGYQRKRTDSDASSERSFETMSSNSVSSRNTLLAVDTLSKTSRKAKKIKDNLQIDGSLLDPNNLWHRPNSSMKFGHVNSLGQFIPEFEPEPDHEKKKFSFQFLKKDTKSEEETAIQIAQKILQDVNILTNYAANANDDDMDVVASSRVT